MCVIPNGTICGIIVGELFITSFPSKTTNQLFLVSGSQKHCNILLIPTKNALNRLVKWPKNLMKIASTTEVFVHSEGSEGITQALDPSILV